MNNINLWNFHQELVFIEELQIVFIPDCKGIEGASLVGVRSGLSSHAAPPARPSPRRVCSAPHTPSSASVQL